MRRHADTKHLPQVAILDLWLRPVRKRLQADRFSGLANLGEHLPDVGQIATHILIHYSRR